MTTKSRKPKQLDNTRVEFLLARYSALREELQYRNTNSYRMISLHLTIASGILTVGLQPELASSVLFIIPITSMLIALLGTHNYMTAKRLILVIKNDVEAEFDFVSKGLGSVKSFIPSFLGPLATGGIFVIVQILAFVLGLIKMQEYTTLDIVLIVSDILSVFIVLWLSGLSLRAQKSIETSTQK